MKKTTVLKLGLLAGVFLGTAAQGQVFNVHQIGQQNFAFYNGYNVLAYGQGAAADPGNNIWNGFGNGGGPGVGWSFGGGLHNDPLVPNNPGNPYAWTTTPSFAHGPDLFSPSAASNGSLQATAGNATSAGTHTPITIPRMVYGAAGGRRWEPMARFARTWRSGSSRGPRLSTGPTLVLATSQTQWV